jgi:hypothetical protein
MSISKARIFGLDLTAMVTVGYCFIVIYDGSEGRCRTMVATSVYGCHLNHVQVLILYCLESSTQIIFSFFVCMGIDKNSRSILMKRRRSIQYVIDGN